MTFGEKLKNLREAKGLSQEELAKALGVSRRTVSNYESGHRYPRYRSIYEKLAALLDTDINYLRTENEEFMEEVGQQYGGRAQEQARNILNLAGNLFAGGELSPDDEIAFLQEMQRLYLDSKKRAKKFTPKKYLNESKPDAE